MLGRRGQKLRESEAQGALGAKEALRDRTNGKEQTNKPQGETRQQQLRMQLATLVKAPNEAMLVYMNRALAIKTELLALEADFNEADIVRQVLTVFFLLNWLHSGAQIQLKSTPQPCGTW